MLWKVGFYLLSNGVKRNVLEHLEAGGSLSYCLVVQCPVRKVSTKVEPGSPGLSLQLLERLKPSHYKFKAAWATE